MRIFVGFVGQPLASDMGVPQRVMEILTRRWAEGGAPADLDYEDLSTNLAAASQIVEESEPDALVLVAAKRRGGRPGEIRIYEPEVEIPDDPFAANDAMRASLEGRVDVDDILYGLKVLGASPPKIVVVECEPPEAGPGIGLSRAGEECASRMAEAVAGVLEGWAGS